MIKSKFKRIRKDWNGGVSQSLPGLDGKRKRKDEALPMLPAGDDTVFDLTSDEEQEIARALKDDALARRVMSLKRKHPYGTVPELIFIDHLDRVGQPYKYQAQLFGGYRSGGLVPDFVVAGQGAHGMGTSRAILINGNYWHQVPGKREKDASDKLRMMNTFFDGSLITDVVLVWESRLMSPDRRRTMDMALMGQELGP